MQIKPVTKNISSEETNKRNPLSYPLLLKTDTSKPSDRISKETGRMIEMIRLGVLK